MSGPSSLTSSESCAQNTAGPSKAEVITHPFLKGQRAGAQVVLNPSVRLNPSRGEPIDLSALEEMSFPSLFIAAFMLHSKK